MQFSICVKFILKFCDIRIKIIAHSYGNQMIKQNKHQFHSVTVYIELFKLFKTPYRFTN